MSEPTMPANATLNRTVQLELSYGRIVERIMKTSRTSMKILLVEDDRLLAQEIAQALAP